MRLLQREEPGVPNGGARTGRQRVHPPISVVVGLVAGIVALVWIVALTPPVRPEFTLNPDQEGLWLWASLAAIVGVLRGIRFLWALTVLDLSVTAIACALAMIEDPQAQTIGGLALLAIALVSLLRPSAQTFEHRRIRIDPA